MNSNPFQSHTWFGKLWNWLFGQENDVVHFDGSPGSSRAGSNGNGRSSSSDNTRPESVPYSGTLDPANDSIFDGLLSGTGVLGSLISSLTARYTGAHLTGAEREANEFSAQQAVLNRDFQMQEAEKARDWQEEQYLRYNSPSALVSQYQQAGINPALMFGGQTPAASTSTAAPSGASAASVSPSSPLDFVGSIISLLKTKAEMKVLDADARQKDANARKTEEEIPWIEKLNGLALNKGAKEIESMEANITKIYEEVQQIVSETNLNNNERKMLMAAQSALAFAQKALSEKQGSVLDLEALEKRWRSDFIGKHHMSPELAGSLATALGSAITGFTGNLVKLFR